MRLPWNRGGLRTYLIGVGLIAGHSSPKWVAYGMPCLVAGMCMHFWAKGCLRQEREVTSSGPYRFVRHPFYLANLAMDAGLAVMSGWWPLMLAFPVWWGVVYVLQMRKEEAIMLRLFGDAYAAYRARVPMLIPYRIPLPKDAARGGFSWRNPNLAGTELPRALRSLSYPLMFILAYRIHGRGMGLLRAPALLDLLLVAACLALHVAAWVLKRNSRRGRAAEQHPRPGRRPSRKAHSAAD